MTNDSPLIAAAGAVSTARADLQRIEARTAELREKSRDLDELQTAVTEARERRAKLLEQALLEGRKANTDEADKAVTKALAALQKREDEITAVARALSTLEAQRQAAQDNLEAALGAFREARACRVIDFLGARLEAMNAARLALSQRITEARNAVDLIEPAKMPADARTWWAAQKQHWNAILDNFRAEVPMFLSAPHGVDPKVEQALAAELDAADNMAGTQVPIQPSHHQADQYVDAHGNITNVPPAIQQATDGHKTITLKDGYAPGMRGAA